MGNPQGIESSYHLASTIAHRSGSNFYRSFALLPYDKRRGMSALYGYARLTDDLGDGRGSPAERAAILRTWRRAVARRLAHPHQSAVACFPAGAGLPAEAIQILPAIADTAMRFEIPAEYLLGIIDGAIEDQTRTRIETFASLDRYGYLVASTVGLSCIHIWGYHEPLPRAAAIDCGVAFQLTNILRDLCEDAARDRIYVPRALWRGMHLTERDMLGCEPRDAMIEMIHRMATRASERYESGWSVIHSLHPDGRRMFSMIWRTYRALLDQIQREPAEVLRRRVRIGRGTKLRIAATHFVRPIFERMGDPVARTSAGT